MEPQSKEANIDKSFSMNLYKSDDYYLNNPGIEKVNQTQLIVDSKRDVQFASKRAGIIPYLNIGLSSAEVLFENSWK